MFYSHRTAGDGGNVKDNVKKDAMTTSKMVVDIWSCLINDKVTSLDLFDYFCQALPMQRLAHAMTCPCI